LEIVRKYINFALIYIVLITPYYPCRWRIVGPPGYRGLGMDVGSMIMGLRYTGKSYRHRKITAVPSTDYLSLSYALDVPQATFFCCAGAGLLSASDAAV
jgi:hypothetical protein